MRVITNKMLSMLERLADMFPTQSYQTKFEQYLENKSFTSIAEVEHLQKEFDIKVSRGEV